jgi:hypothetical protein
VDHRLGRLVGRDLGRRLFGWPVPIDAGEQLTVIVSLPPVSEDTIYLPSIYDRKAAISTTWQSIPSIDLTSKSYDFPQQLIHTLHHYYPTKTPRNA